MKARNDRRQLWLGLALAIAAIVLCEVSCKGAVFFGQEIPTNVTQILFAPGTYIIHTDYTNVASSGFDLSKRIQELEEAKLQYESGWHSAGKGLLCLLVICFVLHLFSSRK
jgi:hypothetical protein